MFPFVKKFFYISATSVIIAIKPGAALASSGNSTNSTESEMEANTVETLLDILRNICPRSIVEACFMTATTVLKYEERIFKYNETHTYKKLVSIPSVTYKDGMNALGIIAFSVTFGAILSTGGERANIVKEFNDEVMRIIMIMVKLIIWYSPIGILFLLMAKMVEIEDLAELWSSLGLYIVTDIAASLIHMFIVLPLLMFIVCRRNPFKYFITFSQAIITAFATASSGASLATSFHCAEQGANIDPRISRFVLPLGATIHMDGTAIYQCISAIYLAQIAGVKMNAGKVIVAGLMSVFAAISAAGVPQGAIVNLVMVLGAIGVPSTEIRLLYATDWLLDRVRTSINVFGDCLCCVIAQRFLQKDLERLDKLSSDGDSDSINTDYSKDLNDANLVFDEANTS
ncbi:hypothetical protein ACOME3_002087 [Neoechinorhynchus agilis]